MQKAILRSFVRYVVLFSLHNLFSFSLSHAHTHTHPRVLLKIVCPPLLVVYYLELLLLTSYFPKDVQDPMDKRNS